MGLGLRFGLIDAGAIRASQELYYLNLDDFRMLEVTMECRAQTQGSACVNPRLDYDRRLNLLELVYSILVTGLPWQKN